MRITNRIMVSHLLTGLNKTMNKMDTLQNYLATGKNINKPSDNPIGTARSMKLNTNLTETSQYSSNVDYAISWASCAESAFSNVTEVMQRVRELTLQGMNGVYAQDSKDAIANELDQLRQQMIDLGNTSNAGRFVFGGQDTMAAPFKDMSPSNNVYVSVPPVQGEGYVFKDVGTDFAVTAATTKTMDISVGGNAMGSVSVTVNPGDDNATVLGNIATAINGAGYGLTASVQSGTTAGTSYLKITSISGESFSITDNTGSSSNDLAKVSGAQSTYSGDNSKIYVEIGPGVTIDINVPGGEPFLSNIAAITNIRNALRNSDTNAMQTALKDVDKAVSTTLTARTDLGARSNRLDLVSSRLEDLDLNFNDLLSKNEDIDEAKTITDLKMQESLQKSSLALGATIIQPTLIDFMR